VLRQPDLAKSLAAISEGGQKEFYEGMLGDRIQAGLKAAGGLLAVKNSLRIERTGKSHSAQTIVVWKFGLHHRTRQDSRFWKL
jgi:hypothetical protein